MAFSPRSETRDPDSHVSIKLQKERIQTKQRGHDQSAAVAVLDIGRLNDGVHQQACRIDENMTLLAFDFLPRIVAMRIDAGPSFSALFTLWLSITAAVGLA